MVTRIKVETRHDDVRVLHAIKEMRNDQSQYLVEFIPNEGGSTVVGKTILKSAGLDNPNLISFSFSLKRGLYDVTVSRVTRIDGSSVETDPETRFRYADPVMVGDPYRVKMKVENAVCYGENGVRVRIVSMEIPLDSQTVYYKIKKENIEHIKYYVPFNQQDRIDFFVKGVNKDEIELFFGTPSFKMETDM